MLPWFLQLTFFCYHCFYYGYYFLRILAGMETLDNPKLKKLLFKLLEPEFKVKNETYLNALLDHLKDSQGRLWILIFRSYNGFLKYPIIIHHTAKLIIFKHALRLYQSNMWNVFGAGTYNLNFQCIN